jgi:hypothetical protein
MFHSASKITLPGGVVGNVCKVIIVLAIASAAIAWSVKVVWVSVAALVLLFILSFVILWRLVTFADRNPQAAILEGAEFLMHEQRRLGTKAQPQLAIGVGDSTEGNPVVLSPDEQRTVLQPDPERPALPERTACEMEVRNG